MNKVEVYKSTECVEVNNYPYGFNQKTICKFSVEFNKNKGFRSVMQTLNPKTKEWNKPKKSTYDSIILMHKNLENKIKFVHLKFYELEDVKNRVLKHISDNFKCFTEEQIKYIYKLVCVYLNFKYHDCGSDSIKPPYILSKNSITTPSINNFLKIAELIN